MWCFGVFHGFFLVLECFLRSLCGFVVFFMELFWISWWVFALWLCRFLVFGTFSAAAVFGAVWVLRFAFCGLGFVRPSIQSLPAPLHRTSHRKVDLLGAVLEIDPEVPSSGVRWQKGEGCLFVWAAGES